MDLIDTPSSRLEEYSTSRIGNAHSPVGSHALRSWQRSNPAPRVEHRTQTKRWPSRNCSMRERVNEALILERFSLKGKTALVTGSSRGLGAGTALDFAEADANVALHGSRAVPDPPVER